MISLRGHLCKIPDHTRVATRFFRLSWKSGGRTGRDIVITGIPRSGTSYLCNLLHRYDNCVIVNEPPEIGEGVMENPTMDVIPELHARLRRSVVWNRPIPNKLVDGKVVEDTMLHNDRSYYSPRVRSADFVLGTKNPLAYLLRLPEIRKAMPNASIAVCVRNPFDTIASWKRSFDQMKNADVAKWFQSRHPEAVDPELAETVLQCTDTTLRRIWWWRLLADLILRLDVNSFQLILYNELIYDPAPIVAPLLQDANPGILTEPLLASEPRTRKDEPPEEELKAIEEICGDAARRLGVWEE